MKRLALLFFLLFGSAAFAQTGPNNGANPVVHLLTNTATGNTVALNNGSLTTIASLSLPPGNWLVFGSITLASVGSSTISLFSAALSQPAGTAITQQIINITFQAGDQPALSTPSWVFNLTATTTIFLQSNLTFSGGSPTGSGVLTAIRLP